MPLREGGDRPDTGREARRDVQRGAQQLRGAETPRSADAARPEKDRLYVGQLIDHGAAPHEFHPKGTPSYFVKLKSEGGGVVTLWGKGLQRAFTVSKTKPEIDDLVGIRENNIDAVSLVTRKRVDGVVTAERRYDTPRPHWVIENLAEFDRLKFAAEALRDPTFSRGEAVRSHPMLLPWYLVLDAAKKTADEEIQTPEGRERFLKLTRKTLALAVERGQEAPLPPRDADKINDVVKRLERERDAQAAARTPE
jgi:hypothetical protein